MTGREHPGFDEVRAHLNGVRPSAEFAPGVRRRIATESSVRRAWALAPWRWAAVAAIVAALAAGAVWRSVPGPAVRGDGGAVPSAAVVSSAQAASNVSPEPVLPDHAASTRLAVVRTRPAPRPAVPSPPASESAGDGLPPVMTNQPAILQALWARSRSSRLVAESTTAEPVHTGEIVVAPILVPEIEVRWLTEPAAPQGSAPIIRKFAARLAERSGR